MSTDATLARPRRRGPAIVLAGVATISALAVRRSAAGGTRRMEVTR